MQDHEVAFGRHRERLEGHVFHLYALHLYALHGNIVRLDPHSVRVEIRAPRLDLELPAVPRALDDLAVARVHARIRLAGQGGPLDLAEAQRRALVRAPVAQGKVAPGDVEHADRSAADRNDLPAPGRQLRD